MKQIILDGNVLADASKVHDYLMEMLKFPEYYGKNLDLHSLLYRGGVYTIKKRLRYRFFIKMVSETFLLHIDPTGLISSCV